MKNAKKARNAKTAKLQRWPCMQPTQRMESLQ